MSNLIFLDSYWRDYETWPNPAEYDIPPEQLQGGWFAQSREVRASPQDPVTRPHEFSTVIKIHHLIVPYDVSIAGYPLLIIDMHTQPYNDINLIATIDGNLQNGRFICPFDKIQNDSNGNPLWIHYKGGIEQALRFKRNGTVTFKVMGRNGAVLPNLDSVPPGPPNPDKQILATFEATPYIRDADFDHHMIEPAKSV
jgi:hypothetical protein